MKTNSKKDFKKSIPQKVLQKLNQRNLRDYSLLKSFLKINSNKEPDSGVVISVIDGVAGIRGLNKIEVGYKNINEI